MTTTDTMLNTTTGLLATAILVGAASNIISRPRRKLRRRKMRGYL